MSIFATMYLHGYLGAAMFLWSGATVADCQKINSEYSHDLDSLWERKNLDHSPVMVDPRDKTYHLKRADIVLKCERFAHNPIRNPHDHPAQTEQ